ncbi:MAG: DUF1207 domain-containing protein [Planctomycetaceae bacterium]|nr:DUF1207 domain-containing protein [Planctomycetaceae bacterium]
MLRCSAGFLAAEELPPIRLSPYVPSAARKYEGVQYQIAEPWSWQMFPDGLLYPAYLAGQQESRLGGVWNHEDDLGWIWDITLGGRAPFVRCGTQSGLFPEGVQIDLEGSVHLRLDMEHAMDMDANDFRFGLPISFSNKIWQIRTGYYHVSSHLGDERMIRMTNANQYHGRNNYYREAVIFGYAYRFTPSTRVYAEADYAVKRGEFTEPWHFQFGAEYSPRYPARGGVGTPFAAVNLLLLEEHNFDGNITVQTGWQWRGNRNQLFRVGVQYFSGISDQYEYIHKREQKIGLGIWYDF